jgi:hypothetical protein
MFLGNDGVRSAGGRRDHTHRRISMPRDDTELNRQYIDIEKTGSDETPESELEAGRKGGALSAADRAPTSGAGVFAPAGALNWVAGIWGGIIAGIVFLALEMIMTPLFLGMSAWAPVRMIAAIVMGEGVLPPPATFAAGIFLVAAVVHFALSAIYGVAVGWLVHRFDVGAAVLIGAGFGLALYLINFYGFTAFFAWFEMARNWVNIFAHVVFGMVAAYAYVKLARRSPERQV